MEKQSNEQALLGLVNEISELIYVADVDTYELYFINDAGKREFHLEQGEGGKCYQILQQRNEPCPFCTNTILRRDRFYEWEINNAVTNKHYWLRDKLIEWNNRVARVEFAFDMTKQDLQTRELHNLLDTNVMIMDCVKLLHGTGAFRLQIGEVLHRVGEFLQADRAYIFQIEGDQMSNTYEWCASNIAPAIKELQDLPLSMIHGWLPAFERGECMLIADVEERRENYFSEYETLSMQNIERLVVAPLRMESKLIGYIGVDNPPAEHLRNFGAPLGTLANFIALTMQRQTIQKRLQYLSYHDELTGFMNRNAFIRDTAWDKPMQQLGVIYLDLNGLKEVNDEHGHQRGDEMLQQTAATLRTLCTEQDIYRVGGDEFVVICKNASQMQHEMLAQSIAERFDGRLGNCRASVGWAWDAVCSDVPALIRNADENMYDAKKRYYETNPASTRYRHG